MSDIVERAREIVSLRGDTFSAYEVIGLVAQMADEIERLKGVLAQGRIAMSDIVERLRKPMVRGLYHPDDDLRKEAADLIERLAGTQS